jgi:hypothetical protein
VRPHRPPGPRPAPPVVVAGPEAGKSSNRAVQSPVAHRQASRHEPGVPKGWGTDVVGENVVPLLANQRLEHSVEAGRSISVRKMKVATAAARCRLEAFNAASKHLEDIHRCSTVLKPACRWPGRPPHGSAQGGARGVAGQNVGMPVAAAPHPRLVGPVSVSVPCRVILINKSAFQKQSAS